MAKKVNYAEVYLDDHIPETMGGLYRINSITEHLSDGTENNAPDFFANEEFHKRDEIIIFVANHYRISKSMVDIVNMF